MTCARCEGRLVRDPMYDLPRTVQEYYCMNCGERFWMQPEPASLGPGLRLCEGKASEKDGQFDLN